MKLFVQWWAAAATISVIALGWLAWSTAGTGSAGPSLGAVIVAYVLAALMIAATVLTLREFAKDGRSRNDE